jgi:hypothetical protein
MSTPNPNPTQPNEPNTPNQPDEINTQTQPNQRKKKVNPRVVFFLLTIIVVVGYLIAVHQSPHHIVASNKPDNSANFSNITVPSLSNFVSYTFNLTNSIQNNVITQKNGTVYLQISGYFDQFPNNYPEPINGKLTIIYMEVTVYNGSSSKSVILPVFSSLNYNKQKYFIYQAEGNLPQLQQLATILKSNEFIGITFYTNTTEIQGYTVW